MDTPVKDHPFRGGVNKILMKDCLSKTIAAVDVDRLTPYDFFLRTSTEGKFPWQEFLTLRNGLGIWFYFGSNANYKLWGR